MIFGSFLMFFARVWGKMVKPSKLGTPTGLLPKG